MAKNDKDKKPQERPIATNRRAWHDFEILDRFEAGIELAGSEVKSLRLGRVDLIEAYGAIDNMQLWLMHLHINEYQASPYRLSPDRKRKLLVHRAQLDRLIGTVAKKGTTLVPLRMYFNERGWAKVEMAVAKARTKGDRRDTIKKKEAEREIRSYKDR